MKDLFGNPIVETVALRKDDRLRRRGYSARPGTGPRSQRCYSCAHIMRVISSGTTSFKCTRVAQIWAGGVATDIHRGAPACSDWERPQREPLRLAS